MGTGKYDAGIDKLIQLGDLFELSLDELVDERENIPSDSSKQKKILPLQ